MRSLLITCAVPTLFLFVAGCGSSEQAARDAGPSSADDAQYLTTQPPENSIAVGDAVDNVQDGERATLVGLIGGSEQPFVDGLAAFTIVDPSVPYCAADEGCPTPWDYCCQQDQVKGNIATVKIVDEGGLPVAQDARQLLGLEELAEVVATGTVRRDEEGNLTLDAENVYVKASVSEPK